MNPSQKLIAVSAFGVRHSRKGLYALINWVLIPRNMKDKTKMEQIIEKAKINYTVIRPTKLTNGESTKEYKINKSKMNLVPMISMATLSDLILRCVNIKEFSNEFITVTN